MDGPEFVDVEASKAVTAPSYGTACLICARNKTRCVFSRDRSTCDRCLRLNKVCKPAPRVRPKRGIKRSTASVAAVASKTTLLEEKLDGIVQLIQRSQAQQPPTAFPLSDLSSSQSREHPQGHQLANSLNGTLSTSTTLNHELQDSTCTGMSYDVHAPLDSPISITTQAISPPKLLDHPRSLAKATYPLESPDESQEYLDTFRTKMLSYFPIIFIGPATTVKQMREQTPVLWLVIRAICNKNVARQAALGVELRELLGREILFNGSKTLDLLLGLMVYAAWGHYYLSATNILNSVVQLAVAMASELGLTKPISSCPVSVMMDYSARGCPKPRHALHESPRTMAERRVVIGLFLASSCISSYFQRIEPLNWSPYLDECLRLLDERADCPNDALLVYLTRVQLVCNKIATVSWSDTFPHNEVGKQFPREFYTHAFKSQLEEVNRSVSRELKPNLILQLYILHANLCIHDHSLHISQGAGVSFDPHAQIQRTENLWTCYAAAKSFFSIFYSLENFPVSCYPQIPFAVFTQLAHCLVTVFRLSTFKSEGISWDRSKIIKDLDFGLLAKEWLCRFEAVADTAGLDLGSGIAIEESPWQIWASRLPNLINWWELKIAPNIIADVMELGSQEVQDGSTANDDAEQQTRQTMDIANLNLDFLDEPWMRDLFPGGYGFLREPSSCFHTEIQPIDLLTN